MPWYALYDGTTGRLHSVGSAAPDPGHGYEVREYAERPDQGPVWDEALREFRPQAPTRRSTISRQEYAMRFTREERTAIRTSPDPVVVDLEYLTRMAETVDLDGPAVAQGLAYLESAGLIAPGRAAQIRT